MGQTTAIAWTDATFNPWWGCTAVSEECDNCYAETFSVRVGFSETGSKFPIWGKDAERRYFGDKHWQEPLKWDREAGKSGIRRRVFCGSMCDVMEDYNGEGHLVRETIEESRQWLYDLIERTPNLDWLLLTKRPQNFRRFLPAEWLERPRPNVWGMTTVGLNESLWRIAELRNTPFVVRGLSMEPLLEPVDLSGHLNGIHWVIVGGESGAKARPLDVTATRDIIRQCKAAGVACFVKQLGRFPVYNHGIKLKDRAGADPSEWPADLRIQQFPERAK